MGPSNLALDDMRLDEIGMERLYSDLETLNRYQLWIDACLNTPLGGVHWYLFLALDFFVVTWILVQGIFADLPCWLMLFMHNGILVILHISIMFFLPHLVGFWVGVCVVNPLHHTPSLPYKLFSEW